MIANNLTAVELFAGIGGFRIAADSLGLKTIWANDINPMSCAVYKSRFKDGILVEGSIEELIDAIPPHDVLTAGFPCQPFSAAGKKEGTRDPRGTLFQAIVEVLEKRNPDFFILENVKRLLSMEHGEHFATVLSALSELNYFIEWRVLNAKNFGLAQNRERVVIVGSKVKVDLGMDDDITHLVRLASEIELTANPKRPIKGVNKIKNWRALSKHGAKFPSWGTAYNGLFIAHELDIFSEAQEKVLLKNILEANPSPDYDLTEATLHRLTSNEPVEKYVNDVEIISNQSGGARMGYTIFGTSGIAPTLTASTSRHYERYFINGRYRRLTPIEYARLQGFPDDHCSLVKHYDQYVLYGNAVPPPMAAWALRKVISNKQSKAMKLHDSQPDLFND